MLEDCDASLKILVVGNGCVGKSSLIRRLCKGQFNDDYKKTIGVDYSEAEIEVPGQLNKVRLMLWDTAGQQEFDPITRSYYENAHAVVLVFSTTDRDSFETVRSWREKVEAVCENIAMVLVQNKIDLIDQAIVDSDEAEALARDMKLKFYRVSVKEYLNVAEVFSYVVELYLKRQRMKLAKQSISSQIQKEGRERLKTPMTKNNFTENSPSAKADIAFRNINENPTTAKERHIKKGGECIIS